MSPIPLAELIAVDMADVWVGDDLVARLHRLPDRIRLVYQPSAVTDGAPAIATTLPVSPDPIDTHAAGALPVFFSGLLPEGRRSTALRRAIKTSADDEFSLLLAIGGDTIGNVRVVPTGELPDTAAVVSLPLPATADFDELFERSTGAGELDRVGLPGVQEKVSARMMNMPVESWGRSAILKLDPPEFPHLVANEAWFLAAAVDAGLTVAPFQVIEDAAGRQGLLIERFDRTAVEGREGRLAVEDACQVLGRYPADKYAVTTEEVGVALVGQSLARPLAALELFRQIVFAYLSCNGDAHAKNFSIIARPMGSDEEWRISPAYDLPTTHPYGDHSLALSVGGKRREDVGRAHLLELATGIGLRSRPAEGAIDHLIDASSSWGERLGELPFDGQRINKLTRAVDYRRKRLMAD